MRRETDIEKSTHTRQRHYKEYQQIKKEKQGTQNVKNNKMTKYRHQ